VIPIQDLLHRIQWDPAFARGEFQLSYYDRVRNRTLRVPMARVRFEKGDSFSFELVDDQGAVRMIPLHRVREVYRDGRCIWQREA